MFDLGAMAKLFNDKDNSYQSANKITFRLNHLKSASCGAEVCLHEKYEIALKQAGPGNGCLEGRPQHSFKQTGLLAHGMKPGYSGNPT